MDRKKLSILTIRPVAFLFNSVTGDGVKMKRTPSENKTFFLDECYDCTAAQQRPMQSQRMRQLGVQVQMN